MCELLYDFVHFDDKIETMYETDIPTENNRQDNHKNSVNSRDLECNTIL